MNIAELGNKTLDELRWQPRYEVAVAEIVHLGQRNRFPSARDAIHIGDLLLVEGEPDAVMRLVADERLEFAAEREAARFLEADEECAVVEVVAGPAFEGSGRTVVSMNFRVRYGGLVLGLWRQGQRVRTTLRRVPIQPGDVLLVRMPLAEVERLARSREFILLRQSPRAVRPRPRMILAVAILALAIALAATGPVHISVAGVIGVVLMLAFRVVPYARLYQAVDWRTLVIIGAMIPLGGAMESTGLARTIGQGVAAGLESLGPLALLAGLFVTTALLTQVMSNAAAIVLMAPIALETAARFSISPHAAMMICAIAASTAFLTPFGHQADILVYNAGGYRYLDFIRVGGPLTLLILVISLILVPAVWPL